jgi:ribosome-binding factor A
MKQRISRVNEMIHREISEILERSLRDPRFGMVTITEVRVSNDLQYAKIFYSIFGNEQQKKEAERMIKQKTPLIQREVGSRIRLRYTPALQFIVDETGEKMDHIIDVLKEIRSKESHETDGLSSN